MKTVLFVGIWLAGMIAWVYLYLGYGEEARQREALQPLIVQARAALEAEDFGLAQDLYEEAAAKMPEMYETDRAELKLRAANAQAINGDLLAAIDSMNELLVTMPASLRRTKTGIGVRDKLARNHYYAAWIMRLEGAPRANWIVHADRARQNYRVLAEQAAADKTPSAVDFSRNLEAVVNLTRMDLPTLKSLPLPPEAQRGRQQGVGQGPPQEGKGEGNGKGQQPGKGKGKPQDARGEGAGPGQRPEAFGS